MFNVKISQTQFDTRNNDNDVVEKWSSGLSPNRYPYVFRYIRPAATLNAAIYDGSSGSGFSLPNNSIDHTFQVATGVFDWPNAQKTLYVEGTSVTSSISVPAPVSNTSPVFLMRRGGTTPNRTAGELRDLLFFNIAISSSQQNQISSQLEML